MGVIEFEHVSKGYHLGVNRTSLREAIPHMARNLFSGGEKRDEAYFWALSDVSFEVEEGEVLGIIGNNGAGKSTTLKLLSKVTVPTSGRIFTKGRMAALIELGAGFHPDLTGRENVYLNGTILGLNRREINAAMADIVDFAGLEQFIDTPVKRYSSGMYVRLAFSIAAHVKAELLLIDEVLSVGDISFQIKSMAKMNELRDSGATIVFISHNLQNVSMFCKRALLLQHGRIVEEGKPEDVVQKYRDIERQELLKALVEQKNGSNEKGALPVIRAVIEKFEMLNSGGEPSSEFEVDDQLVIRCVYRASKPLEDPCYLIRIRRADGILCASIESPLDFSSAAYLSNCIEARVGPLYLQPDYYNIQMIIYDRKTDLMHASLSNETFHIQGTARNGNGGVISPDVEWRMMKPEEV